MRSVKPNSSVPYPNIPHIVSSCAPLLSTHPTTATTTTPPQANTQSSPHPRSTRSNHPNPPRPTTTATLPQQDPQTFLAAETNTATRPLPPTSSHPHEPTRDTHAHPRCRIPTNISPPRFSIPRQESLPQPKNYECSTSRAPTCHKTKPQVDISNDPTPPWSIHSPQSLFPALTLHASADQRFCLSHTPRHRSPSPLQTPTILTLLQPPGAPPPSTTAPHTQLSNYVRMTSKIQFNFRFRRYWWFCLINFWNFITIHVFEVKECISDIPTKQLCSDDLENPVQLPVQEVLMILSYKFLKFHHYLCFRGQGMYFWHSY